MYRIDTNEEYKRLLEYERQGVNVLSEEFLKGIEHGIKLIKEGMRHAKYSNN